MAQILLFIWKIMEERVVPPFPPCRTRRASVRLSLPGSLVNLALFPVLALALGCQVHHGGGSVADSLPGVSSSSAGSAGGVASSGSGSGGNSPGGSGSAGAGGPSGPVSYQGNGEAYGSGGDGSSGILFGVHHYYWLTPGYTCTNASGVQIQGPKDIMIATGGLPSTIQFGGDPCTNQFANADISGFEIVQYNPAYIGYQDRIYEHRVAPFGTSGTVDFDPTHNLTEAWCRTTSATSTTGTDLMVHSGSAFPGPQAVYQSTQYPSLPVPGATQNTDGSESFSMARSDVGSTRAYQTTGVTLTINLDPTASPTAGKYAATLTLGAGGTGTITLNMLCRILR